MSFGYIQVQRVEGGSGSKMLICLCKNPTFCRYEYELISLKTINPQKSPMNSLTVRNYFNMGDETEGQSDILHHEHFMWTANQVQGVEACDHTRVIPCQTGKILCVYKFDFFILNQ